MKGLQKGKGFLFFLILLGAILGSLINDILGKNIKYLSFLRSTYSIGTSRPLSLELKILSI